MQRWPLGIHPAVLVVIVVLHLAGANLVIWLGAPWPVGGFFLVAAIAEIMVVRQLTAAPKRKANPMTETLYERLGAEVGLRHAVDDFYVRVLRDDLLRPYFAHMGELDLKNLRWHMIAFLAQVSGGPRKYEGRKLQEAHAGRGITDQAFDRVGEHLDATLRALGVDVGDRQAVLDAVVALRPMIVSA